MTTSLTGKKILVTGGTGFIGSHLVRRLVHEGAIVFILARQTSDQRRIADVASQITIHQVDIRNFAMVNEVIHGIRPLVVFHLAAEGVTEPFLPHSLALRVNLDGTINVVRAAAAAGAERIVHTGTSYEYGDQAKEGRLDPISPYAASKAAAWAFCRMYHRMMNWPIVCLRLFQVYGPGQMGTLIPSAIEAGLKGQDFPTTSGEQSRDWIYINDVVDAYLKTAIAPGIDGETFDIGTGQGTSVREVVEIIFDHFEDISPQIGTLSYRPGEVWDSIANTAPAKEKLGWEATVSLNEGLRMTLEAMRESQFSAANQGVETVKTSPTTRLDELRFEILDKVSEYYSIAHRQQKWEPGHTRVQYAGRVFDDHEMRNMTESVLEFWLTAGRFAESFEQRLGKYLGIREIIPVNSGSSANLVAMTTLCSKRVPGRPLEPGDEVITGAVAFPTTLAPIIQNGLIPVLVDSQMGNYNLDVNQLEAALSEKTRAIFVTHTLGNPAEMDRVLEFAQAHQLWVIEDNCDALGSRYNGKMTGTFGDLGTSSFYPAHHITLGEGGAVYTNSPRLAKIARTIRDWGRDCWCGYINPPDGRCGKRFEWEVDGMEGYYDHRYLFTEIGYNLKITDPQAAVGLAQMDKLPGFVKARRDNFHELYEQLKPLEEFFILPTWSSKAEPSWFAFPLTLRPDIPFDRESIQRYLESRMIETRLLFAGNIIKQPGYRHIEHRIVGNLPIANTVMSRTFFVGVYPGLDKPRITYLVETFFDFIKSQNLTLA